MTIWWLLPLGLLFLVGNWRHPGLTYALAMAVMGFAMIGLTIAHAAFGFVEGPDRDWAIGWLWVAAFWGLYYGLNLLAVRSWNVVPATAEELSMPDRVPQGWAEADITDRRAWRIRPGHPALILAWAHPEDHLAMFAFHHHGTWQMAAGSSLAGGTGMLWTARTAFNLHDFAELRQIVASRDSEVLSETHRDAVDYLLSEGVVADPLSAEASGAFLMESARRDRAGLLKFPRGIVAWMIRPIFHVGALRTRPGRRWQLKRFAASDYSGDASA